MYDLFRASFLTIYPSSIASGGCGSSQTNAQYVLRTSPLRNIAFILSSAFDVLERITAPLTGLSRRCGTPAWAIP